MSWPPGAHASTFGGNPVACAAALETIRRKPPTGRLLEYVQTACALALFGFLIFVTVKDTGDFFGGGKDDGKTLKIEWLPKEKRSAQP